MGRTAKFISGRWVQVEVSDTDLAAIDAADDFQLQAESESGEFRGPVRSFRKDGTIETLMLSNKELLFCQNYVEHNMSKAEAIRQAGYNPGNIARFANHKLAQPHIIAKVSELSRQVRDAKEMTKNKVISKVSNHMEIAEADGDMAACIQLDKLQMNIVGIGNESRIIVERVDQEVNGLIALIITRCSASCQAEIYKVIRELQKEKTGDVVIESLEQNSRHMIESDNEDAIDRFIEATG